MTFWRIFLPQCWLIRLTKCLAQCSTLSFTVSAIIILYVCRRFAFGHERSSCQLLGTAQNWRCWGIFFIYFTIILFHICSIHYLITSILAGFARGGWCMSTGERRGTRWTGFQSVAGPHGPSRVCGNVITSEQSC